MEQESVFILVFVTVCIAILAFVSQTSPTIENDKTQLFPPAINYAVDTSNTLTEEQLINLNQTLKTIDDSKNTQIGVALVDTIGSYSIEEYAIELARQWKVGDNATDNGVLLVIAKTERQVRIEIGDGVEGSINDAKAGVILDTVVVPELKKGDWYLAIEKGIEAINNNNTNK